MSLKAFGLDAAVEAAFAATASPGQRLARVLAMYQNIYRLVTEEGEALGEVSGKFRHEAKSKADYPAVGDWVLVRPGREHVVIQAVLPRQSKFSRRTAGQRPDEQVVAANIDTVFLVSGLDNDFSVRRLERYLSLAKASGAAPVVLLTKTDIAECLDAALAAARAVTPEDVPVYAVSGITGAGLEALAPYLRSGKTVALLGSSGVGKSTLLNALMGKEAQRVQSVREADSRGRHTTTNRELFVLPSGALIIDTPGMRELQLLEHAQDVDAAFDDIEALAAACKFSDCRHDNEPGCAVQQAVAEGRLPPERLASYHKLERELSFEGRKHDKAAQAAERQRSRSLSKAIKRFKPRS